MVDDILVGGWVHFLDVIQGELSLYQGSEVSLVDCVESVCSNGVSSCQTGGVSDVGLLGSWKVL